MAYDLENLEMVTISETESKEQVMETLRLICDEDFSGKNGSDYTSQEARDAGFNSDFDYHFEDLWADRTSRTLGDLAVLLLSSQYESSPSYYKAHETNYKQVGTTFVIATVAMSHS